MTTMDILRRTKAAWPSICNASAEDKNRILSAMADSLQAECDAILRCNAEDMDAARGHISDVMLDRLYLDKDRIDAMADGIRATVALPDHTGRILAQIDHPNGMKIYKKQVPLGLVAIIYESRPNVTSDAAALTIKSGNVCMLRSGKEAFRTAKAIVAALKQGIASAGGDPDIVNIVEDTSHQSATEIMQAKGLVDLLIPRGGAGLIRFVREQGLWSAARIGALERDADECSERFRDNFCRDGHLYVNNPRRERKVAYPPTRPGVCLYPGHFDYFPETYHFKGCLYFCKDCMTKDHAAVELPEPELFSIPSANLFPIYIGSELFSESEKRAFLNDVVALYERTGRVSGQDRILGYDFGMFLYALCETGHPLRDEVYDRMMSLRDGAGAWVEYYVDGRPSGCGCRPWESGINIEAAIRYAR